MSNLKIAFIPLARTTFDIPFANEMANAAKNLLQSAHQKLVSPTDLITDGPGVDQIIQDLANQDLDLVVIFQATFADSSMAMELARAIDAPIFLWAVPEPHTGGRIRLNSFCGINLAGHALTRSGIHYGYVYAAPDDLTVLDKITVYAKAGRAQQILKNAKLGRVGENPAGFETCLFRPAEIKDRFGVEIVQLDLEEDIFSQMRIVKPTITQPVKEILSTRVNNLDEMDAEAVHGSLSAYSVLKDLAGARDIQGFAVRCWPEFFTESGCAACGAMSMLSDEMIPCSCETDVNGTITQLLLQAVSESQSFGTDMVSIDEERDALVIWHCGLAPLSMADPLKPIGVTNHSNRKLPLLFDFTLKPGEVTVARLSEASGEYRLVLGRGEIISSPKNFSGTSGLLKFDQPARKVIEKILDAGLEHHISLTYGDHTAVLSAYAKLVNLPITWIS